MPNIPRPGNSGDFSDIDDPAEFDDAPPDHECDCSVNNAQQIHALTAALAAEHGVDLCGDDPPDPDEPEAVADLRIIHDLAVAHGAECPDDYDEPDDGADEIEDSEAVTAPAIRSRFRPR